MPPPLTATEAALVDLERQREAHKARQMMITPPPPQLGDDGLAQERVDALTRPVRLEIDFRDPRHTREQLNVLAAFVAEAQALTQHDELGVGRQRMRLWGVMKDASDMLAMLNGKTPAGRRTTKR